MPSKKRTKRVETHAEKMIRKRHERAVARITPRTERATQYEGEELRRLRAEREVGSVRNVVDGVRAAFVPTKKRVGRQYVKRR